MTSIFSKIIAGEIPCYKIYENDHVFAFLDINPFEKGHLLIVPKIEIDKFNEVPEPYYTQVFLAGKKLSNAMEKGLGVDRVAMAVVGTDVPHFHLHLVPVVNGNPLQNEPGSAEKEEMKEIQKDIITALNT